MYSPSSAGARAVTMKKLVMALSGSASRAMETVPGSCGRSENSGCRLVMCFSSDSGKSGSRVSIQPVWIMKPGTTRWNAVPS